MNTEQEKYEIEDQDNRAVRQKMLPADRLSIIKLPIYFHEKPSSLDLEEFDHHYARCKTCMYWINLRNVYIVFDEAIAQYKTGVTCKVCAASINHKTPVTVNDEVFDYYGVNQEIDVDSLSPADRAEYLLEQLSESYYLKFNRVLDDDIRNNEVILPNISSYQLFAGDANPLILGRDPFTF